MMLSRPLEADRERRRGLRYIGGTGGGCVVVVVVVLVIVKRLYYYFFSSFQPGFTF